MKFDSHASKAAVFLFSILMSVSAFSLDSDAGTDDAEDKAKKAPAAEADAKSGAPTLAEKQAALAKAATDPSAILAQLGFYFWTESSSDNNNIANTGLFQPVLPLSKKNVLRPALPIISTGGPNGKFGIGDLFLLDVVIEQVKTGSWGWGVAGTLPTATEDNMGAGKWQAGPALLYMNKTRKKDLIGILGYQQWSFAGDSDRQSKSHLTFQPIWVHHTNWGYYGWTDVAADYDFKSNQFSFPVGLRFGKVFHGKTPLNAAIQPYYTFNNKDRDNVWGIKLMATFIKPTWLKH